MMMGVWFLTSFVGNFIGGWLGSFWTVMDKSAFFLMIAGVAAIAGLSSWRFNGRCGRAAASIDTIDSQTDGSCAACVPAM